MKKIAFTLMMIMVLALPAYAQLGDTDNSSFVIQNLGTNAATVTVIFYEEADMGGDPHQPDPLLPGPDGTCGTADDILNPFSVAPAAKQEVYMPAVCGLADGRYSVVIESTEPVAVIANLLGNTANTTYYNGSYSGFGAGATTIYFPSTQFQYYNWNSLMSIQNTTSSSISVDVSLYDSAGSVVGTKSYPSVPAFSSVHLDLEVEGAGLGLPAGLNGSAKAVCSGACVGTDNQTATGGFTQSYGAFVGGDTTLYAPGLYNGYYTWNSSLKVQNIGTVATTINVEYNIEGGDVCVAPEETIQPNQALFHYLPAQWAGWGCSSSINKIIGATIVSGGEPIVGVANAANPKKQAQTYSAFAANEAASTVGLPVIMNGYYGWSTAFVCQNLDTSNPATVTYSYSGIGCPAGPQYPGCSYTLDPGEAKSVHQPTDMDATTGLYAVTVTSTGGQIACIANETHAANQQAGNKGDWSMSYNGFGQ
jgi:hypothetical protein